MHKKQLMLCVPNGYNISVTATVHKQSLIVLLQLSLLFVILTQTEESYRARNAGQDSVLPCMCQ